MPGIVAIVRRVLAVAALAALLLIATSAGWPHDPGANLPVVVAPGGQCPAAVVPDARGGALVVTIDPCSLYTSIPAAFPPITVHVTHLRESGDIDDAWPGGTPALGIQTRFWPLVVSDSAGGACFFWDDDRQLATTGRDVYAHHLLANGTVDPAWPAGGRAICTAPGTQFPKDVITDGAHGFFVTWVDYRDSVASLNDVYATHLLATGALDPLWPANGLLVAGGPGGQSSGRATPDGHGGFLLTWIRTQVKAVHVLANATLDPAWPAGGLVIANGPFGVSGYVAPPAPDGTGGEFVAWNAIDGVRMLHVKANGTLDPLWPVDGIAADVQADYVDIPAVLSDDSGGAYVAWVEANAAAFGSGFLVVARHALASGGWDPAWPALPLRLSSNPSSQLMTGYPDVMLPDPRGGFVLPFADDGDGTGVRTSMSAQFVGQGGQLQWGPRGRVFSTYPQRPGGLAWTRLAEGASVFATYDDRDSAATYLDTYAQRLTSEGLLGLDAPAIHSAKDTPNDQGGHVTLAWYASAYDTLPADPITEYAVWRQIQAAPAAANRPAWSAGSGRAPAAGDVRHDVTGVRDVFWEYLGSTPARGTLNYALTVVTRADSSASGPAREVYEVDAHGSAANLVISSKPDSGWSVDNLAPPPPTGFAGSETGGVAQLLWDPNPAPDMSTFRLYRGRTPGFVPGPSNLVASLYATHYTDSPAPASYYKLTAVDVHGNSSPAATLLPAGVTAVGDDAPAALAFALASAVPAVQEARFRFALPVAGPVRIDVFDAAGRRVRTLLDGERPAGTGEIAWDLAGRDGAPLGDGLYFARLATAGGERRVRVLVVH